MGRAFIRMVKQCGIAPFGIFYESNVSSFLNDLILIATRTIPHSWRTLRPEVSAKGRLPVIHEHLHGLTHDTKALVRVRNGHNSAAICHPVGRAAQAAACKAADAGAIPARDSIFSGHKC